MKTFLPTISIKLQYLHVRYIEEQVLDHSTYIHMKKVFIDQVLISFQEQTERGNESYFGFLKPWDNMHVHMCMKLHGNICWNLHTEDQMDISRRYSQTKY